MTQCNNPVRIEAMKQNPAARKSATKSSRSSSSPARRSTGANLEAVATPPVKRSRGRPTLVEDKTWFETALKIMASGGVDAVRVEPVAELAGVTKGAFYARFKSRESFLDELLDYWRSESTIAVFAQLSSLEESPEDRLLRVLMLPFRRADVKERGRMEMAIRLWADRYKRAAVIMREIDAHRLQYFESVLLANALPAAEAKSRAFLIYSYIIADGVLPGEREERIREQCRIFLSQGTALARKNK